MPPTQRIDEALSRHRVLAVCALMIVFALQLFHVARIDSATWDEAHHLYDGYTVWTEHDYRLNAEVPPLVKLVAALPLVVEDHLGPPLYLPPHVEPSGSTQAFVGGREFVAHNGTSRTLLPARLAVMIFPLLLAWLVYAASRRMFGTTAALLALALFTFDPNVLANGTIVTTDLGSACCFVAAVYAFYRYVQAHAANGGEQARWLALAAVAAGFTVAAKYTGVLLAPLLLLLCVAEALRARSVAQGVRRFGRLLAALAAIGITAWAMLWAFYGLRDAPAPRGLTFTPALAPYIAGLPNGSGVRALSLVARLHLLPQGFIWGLANTKYTEWEYTSYFFGHVYRHGPHLYFPAAFLIKSTLPLLLLLAAAGWLWRGRAAEHAREFTFLLVPVAVYFAVITASHFDIGARHMMPIYPFLYVIAGATAALLLERRRAVWHVVVALLLLWQAVATELAGPDFMAFGNLAWGGPANVPRYLSDANVDWGQQLYAVHDYLAANRIADCWFAYFPDGAVLPSEDGIPCRRLPTGSTLWWLHLPSPVPPVIHGTVLISDSVMAGVEFGDASLNPYIGFRDIKPIATLRHGVYVYRGTFAVPLLSALVDVRTSGDQLAAGDAQGALATAQHAAAVAPWSPEVQIGVADAFAATGDWATAQAHYRLAGQLAENVPVRFRAEDRSDDIAAGLAACAQHLQR